MAGLLEQSGLLEQIGNWISSDTALFVWKTVATVATAAFGIYGLDVKSRDDLGTFTPRGKVVLAGLLISALITGLIQSGEYVQRQQESATELTRSRQILRSVERNLYPLDPLSISFDLQYSMSDPLIAKYAARVQPLIVANLKAVRQGRGKTSDDLHEENFLFPINSYPKEFQPGSDPNDGNAAAALLQDSTEFTFNSAAKEPEPSIKFLSIDPDTASLMPARQKFGPLSQKVELLANYQTRMFIKRVVTKNLVRMDQNTLAKGAIDLLDRNMTWADATDGHAKGQLSSFALGFSFDYDVRSLPPKRIISIPSDATQVRITPSMIGLDSAADQSPI